MPRDLIGVDLGAVTARAVRLRRGKGGYRVVDYAQVARFDDLGQRKPLARVATELDGRLPLKGRVVVSASDLATMVRFEHNDPMPPDRLERVLRMEISQHGGEQRDLAADAVAVPVGGDELIHCCGLAQPDGVEALLADLAQAKIAVANVDLAPAVLANALRHAAAPAAADASPEAADQTEDAGAPGGFELLVDIGAKHTRVVLTRDGEFLACRQLALGGDQFTEDLAKQRGLRFDEAERLKCAGNESSRPAVDVAAAPPAEHDEPSDLGPPPALTAEPAADEGLIQLDEPIASEGATPLLGEPAAETAPVVDPDAGEEFVIADAGPAADADHAAPWRRSEDGFALDEPELPQPGHETMVMGGQSMGPEMLRVAENLYGQIAKTVSWFQAQLRLRRLAVARVRLAGGGAALVGLPGYFRRRFGVPVDLLDPFAGLDGDGLPVALGGQGYALAIGLALAGEPDSVSFHLIPESRQRRALIRERVIWPAVAAALVLVATGVMAFALWRDRSTEEARLERYQDHHAEREGLLGQYRQIEQQREHLLTDLKSIASRIYGGRDILYAIRALKEQAPDELWVTRMATFPDREQGRSGSSASATASAGARGRAPPGTTEEVRSDTLITTIYVSGALKPTAADADIELYRIFNRWNQDLQAWSDSETETTLFADVVLPAFEPAPLESPGPATFSLQFLLEKTSWRDVTRAGAAP